MMCCAVMLCPVVGAIGWSGVPIVFELVLCFAVTKPMELHVHCFGATWLMLLVMMPSAVLLLVWIGVGGCLCPISSSRCCSGMALRALMYNALSAASAVNDITALMICNMFRIALLFAGSSELLEQKKMTSGLAASFGFVEV